MPVHRMINTVAGKKKRKSERVAEYICSRVMFMVENPFLEICVKKTKDQGESWMESLFASETVC